MQCWCGIYHTDLAGHRHLDAVLRVFLGRAPKEKFPRLSGEKVRVRGVGAASSPPKPRRWAA